MRSFGRIKARALKPRQAGLMETLLPHLALPEAGAIDVEALYEPSPPTGGRGQGEGARLGEGASGAGALNSNRPPPPAPPHKGEGRGAPLILEIGFGGGEHLVAQATAQPDARFIGVEPFMNGVASCLRHVEAQLLPSSLAEEGVGGEEGRSSAPTADQLHAPHPLTPSPQGRGGALCNIRLHMGDARDVIARLPDGCLDLVYILFPDPWPKTRHHKRRLIQPEFLDELARVLKAGGEVRFATDWANYAEWTLWHFVRDARFAWLAERADDWRKPWPGHVTTRYEAKRLGDCAPVWLRFAHSDYDAGMLA